MGVTKKSQDRGTPFGGHEFSLFSSGSERGTLTFGVRQTTRQRGDTLRRSGEEAQLHSLLRALIARAAGGALSGHGTDRVILDTEVAGVRCLLIVRRPDALAALHAGAMLSPRELEVARMVAQGYPNKTIAAVLGISSDTVSTYLRRSFAKLGVHTRSAMTARLLEEELIVEGVPR
jgi:DNA-binding CsgD family transcriptional regulator